MFILPRATTSACLVDVTVAATIVGIGPSIVIGIVGTVTVVMITTASPTISAMTTAATTAPTAATASTVVVTASFLQLLNDGGATLSK